MKNYMTILLLSSLLLISLLTEATGNSIYINRSFSNGYLFQTNISSFPFMLHTLINQEEYHFPVTCQL